MATPCSVFTRLDSPFGGYARLVFAPRFSEIRQLSAKIRKNHSKMLNSTITISEMFLNAAAIEIHLRAPCGCSLLQL